MNVILYPLRVAISIATLGKAKRRGYVKKNGERMSEERMSGERMRGERRNIPPPELCSSSP